MSISLGLAEARAAFEAGRLSPADHLADALHRAAGSQAWLHAFTVLASQEDLGRDAPNGPLHGIPVAIKDIIATEGMVTTNGSPIYAGHVPAADAAIVSRVRALGGAILGKTVTTEFAWREPGPTVNPHNPGHTPGGSSSGSAAAVAAGIVPLALGSQTLGSTIRPAAYCGIVGFKPTFGTFDLAGIHPLAPSLDHLGLFTRTVKDALAAFVLLSGTSAPGEPAAPDPAGRRFVRVHPAPDMHLEEAQVAALDAAETALLAAGADVETRDFPATFWEMTAAIHTLLAAEAAAIYAPLVADHPEKTSAHLKDLVARGLAVSADAQAEARGLQATARRCLSELLAGCDAVLMAPATGPAPEGLAFTGDASPCAPWTFVGAPAITLPVTRTRDRLPLGIQIVSPAGDDIALLARALEVEQVLGAR